MDDYKTLLYILHLKGLSNEAFKLNGWFIFNNILTSMWPSEMNNGLV